LSEGESGFLTAEEILDLKLDADLVVLSACNTGRGKITGDGVIGLSRSFLLAGASSTLVSLWYIPDESTANLMTEFYRNVQDNPNKAQSQRQATIAMMKKKSPSPSLGWVYFSRTMNIYHLSLNIKQ
jgi:CHAT domain-containing protein